MSEDLGTRERIIGGAIRLFAERGYRRTRVGDIEAAAGLSPRSGALYKHFASKQEVLEAAIERAVASIEAMHGMMELMPLGDLRSEVTLLGRWTLQQLDRQRDLLRILYRESDQFPELAARARDRLFRRAYREAAEFLRRKIAEGAFPELDPEAVAAIALGSLANYRVEEALFGAPPAGVDEERLIDAWVRMWLALAGAACPRVGAAAG